MNLSLKRFGLKAVLLDTENLENALAIHRQLSSKAPLGCLECIPAAQTVLVRFDSVRNCENFIATYRPGQGSQIESAPAKKRTIDVCYDGADLADVSELTGLSPEAVIQKHTDTNWRVAFAGFAPGFFYLHSAANPLAVPRKSTPRTAVPAGAVGLAGEFSGIYPRTSPGGWQLIGRTNDPLWDLAQDPPALLEPGNLVQFRAVRELIELEQKPLSSQKATAEPLLEVISPGAQLLLEDSGRQGLTHWGVSRSGFADPQAAHQANYLVGNAANSPVLESLMGGFRLKAVQDCVIALTGAQATATLTAGSPDQGEQEPRLVPQNTPVALIAGQELTLAAASQGLRVYLAVRGGFSAVQEAKSVSSDTLSGLGQPAYAEGDLLFGAKLAVSSVHEPIKGVCLPLPEQVTSIRAFLGPRDDWFTPEAVHNFYSRTWEISADSNRIGVRLKTVDLAQDAVPALTRSHEAELPSEGMISGAVQVPPNGEPLVFLTDHPVTGGYPVIASVHPSDLRLLAQAQPGTRIQFMNENH